MPRPASATPKSLFRAYLPLELRAKIDLALFSELEGKVPLGDYSAFLEARIREYFEWEVLDLEPYGHPAGHFVKAPRAMIEWLKKDLEYSGVKV